MRTPGVRSVISLNFCPQNTTSVSIAHRVTQITRNLRGGAVPKSSRSLATSTTSSSSPLTLSSPLRPDSPLHFSSPIPDSNSNALLTSSPAPFLFYPAFLSTQEQTVLLQASLEKLDTSLSHSRDVRKRRKEWRAKQGPTATAHVGFLPNEFYDFEEVGDPPL